MRNVGTQSRRQRTENAWALDEGYADTLGSESFIPWAQAFHGPCEVDDQKKVAKSGKNQSLLKKPAPVSKALNPEYPVYFNGAPAKALFW